MKQRRREQKTVVIAGGGPTGLMLAAELTLAGVDEVVIVERRATQELDSRRAGGLHARTLEVLDQRGVVDRFVAEGTVHPAAGFAYVPLPLGDLPTRHNYLLGLWQRDFERILAGWVLGELGVTILRDREVVGVTDDGEGVDAAMSDGSTIRADYLVGCDGGRSVVRKAVGIEFPGLDPSSSFIIADVAATEPPVLGIRPEGGGVGPAEGEGRYGIVLKEREVDHRNGPGLDDVRSELVDRFGTDFGVHSPRSISRFTDVSRQAAAYRVGRVVLAGDAAHVHPPQGGQGLNLGVQDAVNLGWKLAQVVTGISPADLLDTYHAERHPVGARVLQNTEAQVALATDDDRHPALRSIVAELLALDEPRRRIASMITGLDVDYDEGHPHPLVGRRLPDIDLRTADGMTTVFALLHEARPMLLRLGGVDRPDGANEASVTGRMRVVDADPVGSCELPVVGEVTVPPVVLIRPDGHVAWAGDLADPELAEASARWFGTGPVAAP